MDIEDNVTAIISTTNLTNVTTLLYLSAVPVTVLFVVGVLGNVFALSLVCYDAKSHKWRPFYRFVCALAISDGGGILASYSIAEYRYISKFNYEFSESLCNYLGFVFMFTLMSSAMIVCCMSLDRFFAIFFPIHYSSPSKGFRTNVIIAVVYCLSGILSSLHLYGLGSIKNFYPGSWCFLNFIYVNSSNSQDTQNKIYSYIYAITGLVVVSLIVVVNSVVVIYFIRNRCILKKSISSTRDLEIIVFLLIIVVVFTSFWAPFTMYILLHAAEVLEGEDGTELTLLRMCVANSVLDPWIYILFRKEIFKLVRWAVEILKKAKASKKCLNCKKCHGVTTV